MVTMMRLAILSKPSVSRFVLPALNLGNQKKPSDFSATPVRGHSEKNIKVFNSRRKPIAAELNIQVTKLTSTRKIRIDLPYATYKDFLATQKELRCNNKFGIMVKQNDTSVSMGILLACTRYGIVVSNVQENPESSNYKGNVPVPPKPTYTDMDTALNAPTGKMRRKNARTNKLCSAKCHDENVGIGMR